MDVKESQVIVVSGYRRARGARASIIGAILNRSLLLFADGNDQEKTHFSPDCMKKEQSVAKHSRWSADSSQSEEEEEEKTPKKNKRDPDPTTNRSLFSVLARCVLLPIFASLLQWRYSCRRCCLFRPPKSLGHKTRRVEVPPPLFDDAIESSPYGISTQQGGGTKYKF